MKLNKLKVAVAVASCAAMLLATAPKPGYALTDAEIDKRLQQIQNEEAKSAQKRLEAAKQIKDIAVREAEEQNVLRDVQKKIDEQNGKLASIQGQIEQTRTMVDESKVKLEEAEKRVESRDQLLKSRVRLMYTSGFVSYMEVLLESTSFSDFLDRYHALQSIIGQDKEILEVNKKDRKLVAEQKQQYETKLAEEEALKAEHERERSSLVAKEKDKEVLISSLGQQKESFLEIDEAQTEYLKKLAAEKSKLWAEKNKNKGQAAFVHDGKFNWPLPGRTTLSSSFGTRTDPFTKKSATHTGWDVPAPAGTDIHASAGGTVIIAQYVNGYGNTVVIDHGGGLQTWYAHIKNNGIDVKEGDIVKAGDVIAHVGSTGRSTGNHLHFEFRKNGTPVNPGLYVKVK